MQDKFRISDISAGAEPTGDWGNRRGDPALADVHRSVAVPKSGWRKFFAFVGPGYMVEVGYMEPGNWATSLAGGSTFGYALLFVALMSNIMAIVLQSLVAGAAAGLCHCTDAVCHRLAVLRAEFHGHGHPCEAGREGGLPAAAHAALGAPADHPQHRHHPGGCRHDPVRGKRNRAPADPDPGGAVAAAQLCRCSTGHVTTDRRKMGALTAPPWLAILAVVIAAIIVVLNLKFLYDFL